MSAGILGEDKITEFAIRKWQGKKKKMPLIKCLHLICEFSKLVELLVYAIKSRVLGEEYKRTCASKGNMKRRGKRSGNEILLRMREILFISWLSSNKCSNKIVQAEERKKLHFAFLKTLKSLIINYVEMLYLNHLFLVRDRCVD